MRKNIRKPIVYKRERVVLSDILPYEVPPFFSNRYFYQFLSENKIRLEDDELRFKKDSRFILEKIVKLIFGIDYSKQPITDRLDYDFFKYNKDDYASIPFKFRIKHSETESRELAVIHPRNQLRILNFYDKYKHSIIKNCEHSKFSIRKPSKIATQKFFRDRTNVNLKSTNTENEIIETINNEYTSLKSYFSYSKYNNIYKFYESHDYQRAEKRFDKLLKFDISRCFPSIYTHSIAWALLNKKCVKDNLKLKDDFWGSRFDTIMRELNYNETNGIVIGPEFSRIFAELILQRIDKEVEKELSQKWTYKADYDIYRYVDDYFLFYTKDDVKIDVLKIYKLKLQEYNLHFNESKTIDYSKPLITNISIAKEDIRHLVEHTAFLSINDKESFGVAYYNTKDVITNYKAILSRTQTSFKDLQNYFLATIFNKVRDSIKYFDKEYKSLITLYSKRSKVKDPLSSEYEELLGKISDKENDIEKLSSKLYNNFKEIIELTFFIYTVHPRVTYSIKVCSIAYRIIDFIKNTEKTAQCRKSKGTRNERYYCIDFDRKHHLYKLIFDNICFVFKKETNSEYSQVETLYLLFLLKELGTHYKVNKELINIHFGIPSKNIRSLTEDEVKNIDINYFTILSLLNYIKRDSYYKEIKEILQSIIKNKFDNFDRNKAEDIFLLIDVLTCPYIADNDIEVKEFRVAVLKKVHFFALATPTKEYEILADDIISYCGNMFYMWSNNNIGRELNTKRGHEVY